MPKEVFGRDYRFLERRELLTFEEIARLARIAQPLGVEKVRITGGEPLVRRDLERLVAMLAADRRARPDADDERVAAAAQGAGARRRRPAPVTVSLDSLDDAVFSAMNDVDFPVERVLEGIDAAAGRRAAREGEHGRQARRQRRRRARRWRATSAAPATSLRFIEYMDVGATNGWRMDDVVPAAEIVARIDAEFPLEPVEPGLPRRGREPLPLPRRRRRDRRDRVGHAGRSAATARAPASRPRAGSTPACSATKGHDLRALLRDGTPDDGVAAALGGDLAAARRPLLRAALERDGRPAEGRDVLHRRLTSSFPRMMPTSALADRLGAACGPS